MPPQTGLLLIAPVGAGLTLDLTEYPPRMTTLGASKTTGGEKKLQ